MNVKDRYEADAKSALASLVPEEGDTVKLNYNPLDTQVGGGHYKDLKIQPVEYITGNNIGYIEGNIIKYITRYATKNGLEDLKKVIHYTELLIQLKYGKQNS